MQACAWSVLVQTIMVVASGEPDDEVKWRVPNSGSSHAIELRHPKVGEDGTPEVKNDGFLRKMCYIKNVIHD